MPILRNNAVSVLTKAFVGLRLPSEHCPNWSSPQRQLEQLKDLYEDDALVLEFPSDLPLASSAREGALGELDLVADDILAACRGRIGAVRVTAVTAIDIPRNTARIELRLSRAPADIPEEALTVVYHAASIVSGFADPATLR